MVFWRQTFTHLCCYGFCGGISVKLLFGTEGYLVKNTSDYLTFRLYDSIAETVTSGDTDATLDDTNTLYVPDIESPLTDEVKLYYNDITDQSDEYTFKFKKGVNLTSGHIYWAVIDRVSLIEITDPETNISSTGTIYIRGLAKDEVDPYGEITLWKSSTLETGFDNWSTYDNIPLSFYNIYTPYYKLRGYLDNGLGIKYPVRRGLKFYNITSLATMRYTGTASADESTINGENVSSSTTAPYLIAALARKGVAKLRGANALLLTNG